MTVDAAGWSSDSLTSFLKGSFQQAGISRLLGFLLAWRLDCKLGFHFFDRTAPKSPVSERSFRE